MCVSCTWLITSIQSQKKKCGGGISTFYFNYICSVPGEGPAHEPSMCCLVHEASTLIVSILTFTLGPSHSDLWAWAFLKWWPGYYSFCVPARWLHPSPGLYCQKKKKDQCLNGEIVVNVFMSPYAFTMLAGSNVPDERIRLETQDEK